MNIKIKSTSNISMLLGVLLLATQWTSADQWIEMEFGVTDLFSSLPMENRAVKKSSPFYSVLCYCSGFCPSPESNLIGSLSVLFLHVYFGLPLFHLLSGIHVNAVYACFVLLILSTSPSHVYLLPFLLFHNGFAFNFLWPLDLSTIHQILCGVSTQHGHLRLVAPN